jgi:hypothetical protein
MGGCGMARPGIHPQFRKKGIEAGRKTTGPMKKLLTIALMALTIALAAGEAAAQVRIRPVIVIGAGRVLPAPRARIRPAVPKGIIIAPSVAMRTAMLAVPNSKPIAVRLRGRVYIVKLKQGGTIRQVAVHAVTGAVVRVN